MGPVPSGETYIGWVYFFIIIYKLVTLDLALRQKENSQLLDHGRTSKLGGAATKMAALKKRDKYAASALLAICTSHWWSRPVVGTPIFFFL